MSAIEPKQLFMPLRTISKNCNPFIPFCYLERDLPIYNANVIESVLWNDVKKIFYDKIEEIKIV